MHVCRSCVENQLYCHDTSTDVKNADEQLEKDLTIEACIENLQKGHIDSTMVTDKSPRTREIAKIDESGDVETSESSVVTYLVTASERQQCKDNIKRKQENIPKHHQTTKQNPKKTSERLYYIIIAQNQRSRQYHYHYGKKNYSVRRKQSKDAAKCMF
jgi:hypothetical protein